MELDDGLRGVDLPGQAACRGFLRGFLQQADGAGIDLRRNDHAEEAAALVLLGAVNQALTDHELIKIKMGEASGAIAKMADEMAAQTQAQVVQVLGKTVLLYRANEDRGQKKRVKLR